MSGDYETLEINQPKKLLMKYKNLFGSLIVDGLVYLKAISYEVTF